jgi:hypothetical protein
MRVLLVLALALGLTAVATEGIAQKSGNTQVGRKNDGSKDAICRQQARQVGGGGNAQSRVLAIRDMRREAYRRCMQG